MNFSKLYIVYTTFVLFFLVLFFSIWLSSTVVAKYDYPSCDTAISKLEIDKYFKGKYAKQPKHTIKDLSQNFCDIMLSAKCVDDGDIFDASQSVFMTLLCHNVGKWDKYTKINMHKKKDWWWLLKTWFKQFWVYDYYLLGEDSSFDVCDYHLWSMNACDYSKYLPKMFDSIINDFFNIKHVNLYGITRSDEKLKPEDMANQFSNKNFPWLWLIWDKDKKPSLSICNPDTDYYKKTCKYLKSYMKNVQNLLHRLKVINIDWLIKSNEETDCGNDFWDNILYCGLIWENLMPEKAFINALYNEYMWYRLFVSYYSYSLYIESDYSDISNNRTKALESNMEKVYWFEEQVLRTRAAISISLRALTEISSSFALHVWFMMYQEDAKIFMNIWYGVLSKFIFVSFFVLFSFLAITFSFNVKLWDALDRTYDNYKRNSELNSLNWKAVVDDIYKKSLWAVKNEQMIPLIDVVGKTSESLNKRYKCSLDSQDIINILYYSNKQFKRDLKNNLIGFVKPSSSNFWKSCNKFSTCKYREKLKEFWWKLNNSITLNNACQLEVSKDFTEFYTNAYALEVIQWWNKWSNLFWNASLDDSSYDIMTDVYNLAKILFHGVWKPAETHFYKMPKVDYNAVESDTSSLWDGDIDWFSPYNGVNVTVITTGSTWGDISYSWYTQSGNWTGTNDIFDESLDADIIDFLEWINLDMWWNWDSIVWWNQCVTWLWLFWLTWWNIWIDGSELLSPWEYLSGIISDLAELSCNNDGVYQDWESSECPDTSNQGTWWITTIEEIEELFNAASQDSWYNFGDDDSGLWCFQKCEDVPCNATSCDKILCYAKCSCLLYESKTFDPSITPGLTSVFKIKFCVVPVMEHNLTTNKSVYNIESIFIEIYNVLQNLRNSGQMMENVKTKEFLDSSLKENSFGQQLSFSINSITKPIFGQISDFTQDEEQKDLNTSWMESLLWFSKDPWLDSEKDKYIIQDDPCIYFVRKQLWSDVKKKDEQMQSCHDKRSQKIELPDVSTMEETLKSQKTVLLDAEFETFLRQNRDFWYVVDELFASWLWSADILKNK